MLASGLSRRALVVGGDVLSKILDWEDRSTLVLFGDGAGAVVMEPVERGRLPRLRARRRRRRRRPPLLPGQRLAALRAIRSSILKMNGREVFKFATRVMVTLGRRGARRSAARRSTTSTCTSRTRRTSGSSTTRSVSLGIPVEKTVVNVDRYGNTSSGSIPLALADARADGRLTRRRARADDGHGSRAHVGLGAARMDGRCRRSVGGAASTRRSRREARLMGKVAFCFPGQGSLEEGMGREIAEAVPEAMDVYRRRQRGDRHGPRSALLRGAARDARRDGGAAADARRDEPRDPRRPRGGGARARTSSSATRSASSRRSPPCGAMETDARRSASCASAGSRWPRPRGSGPARWPRSSGSRTSRSRRSAARSSASGPRTTTAPGQIVVSGENDAVDECFAQAESLGARRAIRLKVSGAFHSPLVARAADALKPAIDRVRFSDPVAPFMSTVTAQDRAGAAARLAARRPADGARCGSRRPRARSSRRTASRRSSRSGPAPCSPVSSSGSTARVRTISVNDLASLEKAKEALAAR